MENMEIRKIERNEYWKLWKFSAPIGKSLTYNCGSISNSSSSSCAAITVVYLKPTHSSSCVAPYKIMIVKVVAVCEYRGVARASAQVPQL